jgi:NUMOD3 motif
LGFKHSEETKAKIRAAVLGRKHSEETLAKFRARRHSSATIAKISAARLNNPQAICKQIEVTDIQTGISTVYNSINLAGKALNVAYKSIICNINAKNKNLIKVVMFLKYCKFVLFYPKALPSVSSTIFFVSILFCAFFSSFYIIAFTIRFKFIIKPKPVARRHGPI